MYTLKQDEKWPFVIRLMENDRWLIIIGRCAWSTHDTLETVNQRLPNVEQLTKLQRLVDLANREGGSDD